MGNPHYDHKLIATILSLIVCYSMYSNTLSLEYPFVMFLTSIFYGFIEYFGAKRNVRKGQPLSKEAKLFGYNISIFTGSMLRGFGEMGSCMLLGYILSDWYLYEKRC